MTSFIKKSYEHKQDYNTKLSESMQIY